MPPNYKTQRRSPVKAPIGKNIGCQGAHQEAAMRVLMNKLDPASAEEPHKLIVYNGTGKATRDWACRLTRSQSRLPGSVLSTCR